MRLAVLSDIHGNTPALRAVLAAVDRVRPDLVINLGDVASGAVDPRGTLDLLRRRDDILTLRGNHERQLLDLTPGEMGAVDAFTAARLVDEDRCWMARLPTDSSHARVCWRSTAHPATICATCSRRSDRQA